VLSSQNTSNSSTTRKGDEHKDHSASKKQTVENVRSPPLSDLANLKFSKEDDEEDDDDDDDDDACAGGGDGLAQVDRSSGLESSNVGEKNVVAAVEDGEMKSDNGCKESLPWVN
jgi:hypothetical protein